MDTTYRDVIQDNTDLEIIAGTLDDIGLSFTWSGLCVWVETLRSIKAVRIVTILF